MSDALPRNTLIAHSKALEAAGMSIALVTRVPAPLKSIADQAIRSASSVPADPASSSRATASSSQSEDGCGSRLIVVRHKPQSGAVISPKAMGRSGEIECIIGASRTVQQKKSTPISDFSPRQAPSTKFVPIQLSDFSTRFER